MFGRVFDTVKGEVSGKLAYEHVAKISDFHRIQVSPGIRGAVEYSVEAFKKNGLAAEALKFEADGTQLYLSWQPWREWSAEKAVLWLVEPESERRKLADYAENNMHIIQWSVSTPPDGVTAELVIVNNANRAESYAGLDVKGKVVLIQDRDIDGAKHQAVDVHGAIGIVADYMMEIGPVRHRMDIPDAIHYTAFRAAKLDNNCFGFALSPKQGESLRHTVLRAHAAGQTVKVHAEVKAGYYDGYVNDADAFIPGETDEEVVAFAHICHPRHSANDNASGCGVLIETARALRTLIAEGKLAKPKRGIRFILGAEMTGSYAYVHSFPERIAKTVAGLNLDMVGQNQALTESILQAEQPPRASASYVGDLMAALMGELASETPTPSGTRSFALFRHAVTPFSGGSDHMVFTDPTVGVPCGMVINWPDKFYHTSADTIDKVDPDMLRKVGVFAGTYLYFVANAGETEALWLAQDMAARYRQDLTAFCQDEVRKLAEAGSCRCTECLADVADKLAFAEGKADFLADRKAADLAGLTRLVGGAGAGADPSAGAGRKLDAAIAAATADVRAYTRSQKTWMRTALESVLGCSPAASAEAAATPNVAGPAATAPALTEWEAKAARMVPRKLYRGPLNPEYFVKKAGLEADYRKVIEDLAQRTDAGFMGGNLPLNLSFWVDGKRNLLEIARLVRYEIGKYDPEFTVGYFGVCGKAGLVEIINQ